MLHVIVLILDSIIADQYANVAVATLSYYLEWDGIISIVNIEWMDIAIKINKNNELIN